MSFVTTSRRLLCRSLRVPTSSSCRNAVSSVNAQLEESIQYYGRKRQTNVSLKALVDTGKGTLVEKMTSNIATPADATATEKVLIQGNYSILYYLKPNLFSSSLY